MFFTSYDVWSFNLYGFLLLGFIALSLFVLVYFSFNLSKCNSDKSKNNCYRFMIISIICFIASFILFIILSVCDPHPLHNFEYTEYYVTFYNDNFKNEMLLSNEIQVIEIDDKNDNKYTLTGDVLTWADKWIEYKTAILKE